MLEEETQLYDKINKEEDKFFGFCDKENQFATGPLKESKTKLLNQQLELKASFDDIKQKLDARM